MQSRGSAASPRWQRPCTFADAVTRDGVVLGAPRRRGSRPRASDGARRPRGRLVRRRARGRPAEGRARARVLRAETAAVAAACLLAALRCRPGARSRRVRSPSRSIAHRDRRRYGGRRTWGGAGQGRAQVARQGRGMTDERLSDDEPQSTAYGRKVGERLRGIRRQKRLSLQDVEADSLQEFKASVLGAYERGERAISVPRLQRLARFYNVPVDQLLPADEGPEFDSGERHRPHRTSGRARPREDRDRPDPARRDQRARRRDAHPLPRDDPGAATGLQRPRAHRARRRPAGDRLHPRRRGRPSQPPPRGSGPTPASPLSAFDSTPQFGVYVHIPFCAKRCDYCAFATWTDRMHLVDAYLDACVTDLDRAQRDGIPSATSVFFGGGTPSLVPGRRADAGARPHRPIPGRRGDGRVQPRHRHARAPARLPRAAA